MRPSAIEIAPSDFAFVAGHRRIAISFVADTLNSEKVFADERKDDEALIAEIEEEEQATSWWSAKAAVECNIPASKLITVRRLLRRVAQT